MRRKRNRYDHSRVSQPPYLDTDTLDEISNVGCETVFVPDFGDLPIVSPKDCVDESLFDPIDFDRRICKAGVKTFIRRVFCNDTPDDTPQEVRFDTEWLIIKEFAPGIRTRIGVTLIRHRYTLN